MQVARRLPAVNVLKLTGDVLCCGNAAERDERSGGVRRAGQLAAGARPPLHQFVDPSQRDYFQPFFSLDMGLMVKVSACSLCPRPSSRALQKWRAVCGALRLVDEALLRHFVDLRYCVDVFLVDWWMTIFSKDFSQAVALR